ncbi:enoyl-CoA hydratase-related protein [Isoptericola dokdonensis]|uniref:1,2-epoxyphenylacetyl-CoA isomerase n=1 Tax=Isoptericola dokdonensis DS-3 TaxID=1300344 RepID=A0A161I125_9MICO|nr:enoyl-CoA hydratase-related protein [Isoptericola dokdonensis]ANC29819.1 1,2-epoxyphenylacetyl-CoA isomerase [Isoptericola dokdonensis DS-3]
MPALCRVDRDGAVATVVLDRPEHRNALDLAHKEALLDALEDVARDPEVRAVVLTGSGPAFCVGQDLREHAAGLADGTWDRQRTVERHYNAIVRTLTTMPQPVVDHGGGIVTRDAHVLSGTFQVSVGDTVTGGQQIASVGGDRSIDPADAGTSTGCHLHFEVQRDGQAIDPGPFFTERGITLGS